MTVPASSTLKHSYGLDTLSNILVAANRRAEDFTPDAFLSYLQNWDSPEENRTRLVGSRNDTILMATAKNSEGRQLLTDGLNSVLAGAPMSIDERLCRALDLIEKIGYYNDVLPWLCALTEKGGERVRSKAAKLLCKAMPRKPLVERLLKSNDARVRANAVEALWFHQTPDATAIFRQALSDPSHRVVVNALIGLYHQHDSLAMQQLIELSNHPSQMFRTAALWGFLCLQDDRAIGPLKSLVQDPSDVVRDKANNVLAKLLYVRDWVPEPSKRKPILICHS
jgi:hypothetical protein